MTTAPTTYRPESLDHLDDDPLIGDLSHNVFTVFDMNRLARVPGALAALGALVDACRASDVVDTVVAASSLSTITVKEPFDTVRLQAELRRAQERYDVGRAAWQDYLDEMDGDANIDAMRAIAARNRYAWGYYLRREGIDAPKHEAQ